MGRAGCQPRPLVVWLWVLALPSVVMGARVDEEKLIGWRGETYNVEAKWDPLKHEPKDDIPLPASKAWIEHVAWEPRVFIYHNLITEVEAKHLIDLSVPTMKRSTVVGQGGRSVEDSYRTSYGTFLRRYQDEVVERIENRVAAWTMIPVAHQEDLQILRYGIGQQYKVHSDTLQDNEAGVRVATVLIYLNEPDEGGETAFPSSSWVDPSLATRYGANFSECAKNHVAFTPKRGDALLFWTATKWIHARPFRPSEMFVAMKQRKPLPNLFEDPGTCRDNQSGCAEWAARGDCEKNHDFMVVSATAPGSCRLSCGACKVCTDGDQACFNNNREQIGFLVFNATELRPIKPMV